MVLVDAHTHLRRCFDVGQFLEKAYANFKGVCQGLCSCEKLVGVLFLTESAGEPGFQRLLQQYNTADDEHSDTWRLQGTLEPMSNRLQVSRNEHLIVIAGHQITSHEGLEVLAVGTRQKFDDGRPISALIRDVARAGALPIVPWGVGKWLGMRGELVENLIKNPKLPTFFLGDNANRPSFWPLPAHFDKAEDKGIRNLPGSDPLPFPGEVQQVGSFGVALDGSLDLGKPAQDLKRRLLDPSTTLQQFGYEETPFRFARNQLKMQYRKLTR